MPRYYCDYCDTYLTHDSQAGRLQHIRGWKHRENVKLYYEQFLNIPTGMLPPSLLPGSWLQHTGPSGPPLIRGPPAGMRPPPGPPPGMLRPPGPPPFGIARGPPMATLPSMPRPPQNVGHYGPG